MLSMFLSDDMVVKVTNIFKLELRDFLIEYSEDLSEKIEETLSVEQIVQEKVEAFSSDKLEEILNSIMKKEFRFIEIIGATLGFLIGCVQVCLAALSN